MNKKTINVEGMTCVVGVSKVKKALEAIPGVSAETDLRTGKISVSCPEGVDSYTLTKTVNAAGFAVKNVE